MSRIGGSRWAGEAWIECGFEIRGEASERFNLLFPGFLIKTPGDKIESVASPDQCGEAVSSEDPGAPYTAETVGDALHQRDESVALEYIVGDDFDRGQQLNSSRSQAFQDLPHYIL